MQAHEFMVQAFLDSPETIVFPHTYIENVNSLVNPPLMLYFPNMALMIEDEAEYKAKGGKVDWAHYVLDDGTVAAARVLVPMALGSVHIIDRDLASEVSRLITIIDFCFSEFDRKQPEFKYIGRKQFAERLGLQPFNILW